MQITNDEHLKYRLKGHQDALIYIDKIIDELDHINVKNNYAISDILRIAESLSDWQTKIQEEVDVIKYALSKGEN